MIENEEMGQIPKLIEGIKDLSEIKPNTIYGTYCSNIGIPLETQLKLGMRQFHFNVFINIPSFALSLRGKNTNYTRFKEALQVLRTFCETNEHDGIFVYLNTPMVKIFPAQGYFSRIENEIFFAHIPTLSYSDSPFPSWSEMKNKVVFILNETGLGRRVHLFRPDILMLYPINGLKDKFHFVQDPLDYKSHQKIEELVAQDKIVRTHSFNKKDSENDFYRRLWTRQSAAQIVTIH